MQFRNDFFTKNRVKTALRVGADDILFVNKKMESEGEYGDDQLQTDTEYD